MKRIGRKAAAAMLAAAVFASVWGCKTGGGKSEPTAIPAPEAGTPEYTRISTEPKTDWQGQWIWCTEDPGTENVWTMFRKTFSADSLPGTLPAHISADSRYWLWVNGTRVVYEGSLKRGPDKESGYYDTVDIAPYLQPGDNVIAALVWYWGKDQSFSYIDSGSGGFLFEAVSPELTVLSDSTWLARKDPAFLNDTGAIQPNYRIPEFNIFYDARLDPGNWTGAGFDAADWDNAQLLAATRYGDAGKGTLYPRPIPFLRTARTEYENGDRYKNYTTKTTEYITVTLPYNMQCAPCLKVKAEAGKKIVVTTENTHLGSVITTYVTKDGEQEFESPGWFNGEQITYKVPADVTVLGLWCIESGYSTRFSGVFDSDDGFFDELWQKSLRTLYVTMRDNFMDCPDRERAQWWGDVTSEMAMTMYAMDTDSYLLYQKGVFNMIRSADPSTGVLQTVVPVSDSYFELPMQQLAGICGFGTYYMYTGDREFADLVYEPSIRYLRLWKLGSDGLAVHRGGSWDWMDWGENADVTAIENAWYYMALSTVREFAVLEGDTEGEAELSERMESIRAAYQTLWTKKGFRSRTQAAPDDRANALAVLAGLADLNDPEVFSAIRRVLTGTTNSSPYMERYVLDALYEMGLAEDALARMKTRYKDMVEADYSTLWEFWDSSAGTMNHAWSGGPLIALSRYAAGVRPAAAGYGTVEIVPAPGSLKNIHAVVPTVRGLLELTLEAAEDSFKLDLNVEGSFSKIRVGIPRIGSDTEIYMGDRLIFACGKPAGQLPDRLSFENTDTGYIYFSYLPETGKEALSFTAIRRTSGSGTYTLSFGKIDHGTLTVNGAALSGNTVTVNAGESVVLAAGAEEGWEFAGYSGSIGGKQAEIEFTPGSDCFIEAQFVQKSLDYVTVSLYLPAGCDLKLTANGKPVSVSGTSGYVRVRRGSGLVLRAEDGRIHRFLNYSGDAEGDEPELTLAPSADMKIMVSTGLNYGEDLAKGAKASCSVSMESAPVWSLTNLTDGSLSTGFTTDVLKVENGAFRKAPVIEIDLGSVKNFSLLSLAPRPDTVSVTGGAPNFPAEFNVYVSADGGNFKNIGTFTGEAPDSSLISYELGAQRARYLRLEFVRPGDIAGDEMISEPYRVQLFEIMLRNKTEG